MVGMEEDMGGGDDDDAPECQVLELVPVAYLGMVDRTDTHPTHEALDMEVPVALVVEVDKDACGGQELELHSPRRLNQTVYESFYFTSVS